MSRDAMGMRIGSLYCRIRSRPPRYAEMLAKVFRTDLESDSPPTPRRAVELDVSVREKVDPPAPLTDSLSVQPFGEGWELATDLLVCRLTPADRGHTADFFVRDPDRAEGDLVCHFWIVCNRLLLLLDSIVLHAAALDLDGSVDLFCGHSGAGKSTLAVQLALAGASVLADDHVVARRAGSSFLVSGCSSRLRVAADTESCLLPDRLESVAPSILGGRVRKEFQAGNFFPARPHRDYQPRRLFLLAPSDALSVEPASAKAALLHLIETSKEMMRLSNRADHVAFLDLLADLATSIPAYHLRRGRDLRQLDRLPAMLRGLAPGSAT